MSKATITTRYKRKSYRQTQKEILEQEMKTNRIISKFRYFEKKFEAARIFKCSDFTEKLNFSEKKLVFIKNFRKILSETFEKFCFYQKFSQNFVFIDNFHKILFLSEIFAKFFFLENFRKNLLL